MKEKDKYYEEKSLIDLEEKKQKKIRNKFKLQKIYYSLDGKNIFKRVDRYYYKKTLLGFFIFLFAYNLFEILFNIILLFFIRKQSKEYNDFERKATLFINMVHIIIIQILATLTIVKRKIKTYIYY